MDWTRDSKSRNLSLPVPLFWPRLSFRFPGVVSPFTGTTGTTGGSVSTHTSQPYMHPDIGKSHVRPVLETRPQESSQISLMNEKKRNV